MLGCCTLECLCARLGLGIFGLYAGFFLVLSGLGHGSGLVLDLLALLFEPFVKAFINLFFSQCAFFDSFQKVLLQKNPFIGKNGSAGIRWLCTFLQPLQGGVEVQIDGRWIGVRIVLADLLDESSVPWRPAVCSYDGEDGAAFAAMALQSDAYWHDECF